MKIKYEIDLDDFFVFSDHLMKTSPLMLRAIRKGQMWWASGPLAGGFVVSILKVASPEKSIAILAILSVAVSLPMFLLYPHYFKYRNKKQIKELQKSDNYKGVLGAHEMTITDEYLAETTEYNGSKIPWNALNKIETVSDNTYVFTGELTAYIIPHKKIIDGDAAQFVTKLNDTFKRTVG
jgi:hypothetical protein